jgi:hypothetical protein
MPSYLSAKNRSETPLGASATFFGGTDYVLNYTNCDISIRPSTDVRVKIFGSITGSTWATIFDETVNPGQQFFQTLLIYHPFLRSEVENLDAVAQTYLDYQLIYREHAHAFTLTEATLTAPIEVIDKQRFSQVLWDAATVVAGGSSNVANLTNSKFTTITIYGTVDIPCTLTIQFSQDNTAFYNSQYSFTVTSVGGADFGASIACSASYVRLKRTDSGVSPATVSAVLEAT